MRAGGEVHRPHPKTLEKSRELAAPPKPQQFGSVPATRRSRRGVLTWPSRRSLKRPGLRLWRCCSDSIAAVRGSMQTIDRLAPMIDVFEREAVERPDRWPATRLRPNTSVRPNGTEGRIDSCPL
jgi:hypothetical protein